MKEALKKARIPNERKKQHGGEGGTYSSETLKRDASDYHVVWRIKEDGSTRGYFI